MGTEAKPSLQAGVGFHLQPDGSWEPEKIPPQVLKDVEFSGYLTIDGYRSTVFETPSGDQWAQKSVGTPATAGRVATSVTPDQLKQSLVAQLFAWDEKEMDYVRSVSPTMKAAVSKARAALKANGVGNIIDLTGDASFPAAAHEKDVRLMVDLQYVVDGKSVALEGASEAGLGSYWRDIYGDVAHAVGPVHSKGASEKDPGLPSDPDETLWWNGKTFSSEEPSTASGRGAFMPGPVKHPRDANMNQTLAQRVASAWLEQSQTRDPRIASRVVVGDPVRMLRPEAPSVAARVAEAWIRQADRADDLVAQVSDVMEDERDDAAYDEQIVKYCDQALAAVTKIQQECRDQVESIISDAHDLAQAGHEKVQSVFADKVREQLVRAALEIKTVSSKTLGQLAQDLAECKAEAERK